MRKYILIIPAAVIFLCIQARTEAAAAFDHSRLDVLLRENVHNGLVDYRHIKDNPGDITKYIEQLKSVDPGEFRAWSSDERLAFWINTYNAITIHAIIRNYPIKPGGLVSRLRFPDNSIRQIEDVWDTVHVPVMRRDLTLNQIEHEIIRKEFDEPRIHFALVCAALGCPELRAEAYEPARLDEQLDDQTKRFISNREKVRLDRKINTLFVSSIFEWFAKDFSKEGLPGWTERYGNSERGIAAFAAGHLSAEDSDYIIKRLPAIKFLDYDWTLNEWKNGD